MFYYKLNQTEAEQLLLSTAPWSPLSGRCWWSWTSCCLGANCPEPASWSGTSSHTHTPMCEVHRFDLSRLLMPQKGEPHLEDVGGVGQTGGHDSRHHTTEHVDDHRLICGQQQFSTVSHQQTRFGIITSSGFMSALWSGFIFWIKCMISPEWELILSQRNS